jgi:hypothetical protein
MAIYEIEPRLKIGPLNIGSKLGEIISGDRGLRSIRFLLEGPDDESILLGSWHGYYVRILDENTILFGRATNIDAARIQKKEFVDQRGVFDVTSFVLPGKYISGNLVNQHPIAKKIVRWIP